MLQAGIQFNQLISYTDFNKLDPNNCEFFWGSRSQMCHNTDDEFLARAYGNSISILAVKVMDLLQYQGLRD